jgi:hypothetical protein
LDVLLVTVDIYLIFFKRPNYPIQIDTRNNQTCNLEETTKINLNNFNVEFSRRQANGVVHELAQTTSLEANSQLSMVVPPCIYDLLTNEMR